MHPRHWGGFPLNKNKMEIKELDKYEIMEREWIMDAEYEYEKQKYRGGE